jgi:hypothetical protein
LEGYDQVWILFGESGRVQTLSDDETQSLSMFTGDGKGMLIVAGSHRRGIDDSAAENRLSSRYGVTFSGFVDNGDELNVSTASHFLTRMSEMLGKFLKLVHKA